MNDNDIIEGLKDERTDYRILTKDRKILYTGTEHGSWFNLSDAKNLVNRKKGEMIYEYKNSFYPLWEIL